MKTLGKPHVTLANMNSSISISDRVKKVKSHDPRFHQKVGNVDRITLAWLFQEERLQSLR